MVLTMQDGARGAGGGSERIPAQTGGGRRARAGHTAVEGGVYLNPELGARLAAEASPAAAPPGGLTDRETQVLRLLALGYSNREIGEQRYLSVRTVESHHAHIQRKLGFGSRAELVRHALDAT